MSRYFFWKKKLKNFVLFLYEYLVSKDKFQLELHLVLAILYLA